MTSLKVDNKVGWSKVSVSNPSLQIHVKNYKGKVALPVG
jgi:hypothetical protein